MNHPVTPDPTKRTSGEPTHFHCYKWTGSGQQYANAEKTDTLDLNSPDRPPINTVNWLIKSSRFIAATYTTPSEARDWLMGEWKQACDHSMNPIPDWVSRSTRGAQALRDIETQYWPSWSQWLAGGSIVLLAVIGTSERCH